MIDRFWTIVVALQRIQPIPDRTAVLENRTEPTPIPNRTAVILKTEPNSEPNLKKSFRTPLLVY